MKYIAIAIGYLIIWSILLLYLIIERVIKYIIIISQIVWHLRIERQWFDILKTYWFFIPFLYVVLSWEVKNLKDYFLVRNWEYIK
jgi:hypothetical protein